MQLLVVIVNKPEKTDSILEDFLAIGIRGASIVEATGMGRVLCEVEPMFGGLRNLFKDCRPTYKMIMSVIKEEKTVKEAISVVKKHCGNLKEPGSGFLFTIPVDHVLGFAKPLNENGT